MGHLRVLSGTSTKVKARPTLEMRKSEKYKSVYLLGAPTERDTINKS